MIVSPNPLADDIDLLEKKVRRLKSDYEQYFLGFQKTPPSKLRIETERLVLRCSNQRVTNTALNFRCNTVIARYNSYRNYWDRIIREIEEGRYERDLFKMKLHDKVKSQETFDEKREDSSLGSVPHEQPDEDYLRNLYKTYSEARKETGEPTVGFSTVKELIEKKIPAIKKKYNASSVDFKVVIEGGKTKLKAVPKK